MAPRSKRRPTLVAALILVASVTTPCVVALRETVVVSGRSGLHRVGFGWPMHWLFQDQRSLDPPFPSPTTALSPWEYPVSAHLGAFAVDGLVVLLPLLVVWLGVRRLRRDA
jgi:hypothetical protein